LNKPAEEPVYALYRQIDRSDTNFGVAKSKRFAALRYIHLTAAARGAALYSPL
jgi:hypothetical protein